MREKAGHFVHALERDLDKHGVELGREELGPVRFFSGRLAPGDEEIRGIDVLFGTGEQRGSQVTEQADVSLSVDWWRSDSLSSKVHLLRFNSLEETGHGTFHDELSLGEGALEVFLKVDEKLVGNKVEVEQVKVEVGSKGHGGGWSFAVAEEIDL